MHNTATNRFSHVPPSFRGEKRSSAKSGALANGLSDEAKQSHTAQLSMSGRNASTRAA